MRKQSFAVTLAGCGLLALALALTLALVPRTPAVHAAAKSDPAWNPQAAAHYLDARETWWQAWPRAQKDHGTYCISCHTVVPYAMARSALLAGADAPLPEQAMLASVEKRVSNWSSMEPFYPDAKYGPGKSVESRATEAVLNAIILASVDAASGSVSPVTRTAFENAWALQETSGPLAGGWKWQDFHLGPWESTESGYQGAALLMVQSLSLPAGFARERSTRVHLNALRSYLRRNYAAQPLVNHLYMLWASAREPKLLTRTQRQALLASLRRLQQPDGGFRLASLDPRERVDHSPTPTSSDGYATGLVALALESSGKAQSDATLRRSLAWLTAHQQTDGTWTAASLNKQRDPSSDPAAFMTDAATAYAVLALEQQP